MTNLVHIDTQGNQYPPKQPNFEAVLDPKTGLMWSIANIGDKKMTHAEAEKAVKELRLCGYNDWRIPTIKELLTLVDYSRFDPAIDTEAFPDCKSDWYWSSSPVASNPTDYAWIVNFDLGNSLSLGRYYYAWVRAVRGPASQ